MTQLKDKIRLIYLTFLLIAIVFVFSYSFLHWFFIIRNETFLIKEDILKFWLPFGLPWIPVFIWLRPRIKLLRFKNDNGSFFYQFLATLAIAVPTMVAQEYLVTATGKLTSLQTITGYNQKAHTKYYTLDNFLFDRYNASVENTVTVTGKNNETLNLFTYVAIPVFDRISDTTKGECSFYLGKTYRKSISNSLSDQEKEEIFSAFIQENQQSFDTTNFRNFVYLERVGFSDDLDAFKKAIKKNYYVRYNEPVVFVAHNDPFQSRNGNKLQWIFISFGIGVVVWYFLLLIVNFDEKVLAGFRKGIRYKGSDIKEALQFLIPRKGYYITALILDLNLLIYLLMVFAGLGFVSFKAADLLDLGGNYGPYVATGEWWRLVTSVFLHGGFFHLITNMGALLFAGLFLEPALGSKKYLLVYLATGIIASCTSLWWHPATVSVGASGAIFGLYGLWLAFLLLKVFPKELTRTFLIVTILFVGYNLLMGMRGNVDNAAHLGGLISGFVVGLLMTPYLKKKLSARDGSSPDI